MQNLKVLKLPANKFSQYFKPRWIVADAPRDHELFRTYFWTRQGAIDAMNLARLNYIAESIEKK